MTMGPPRAVRVRPASVDDARGIAAVHVQAWREAYVRQLPATVLAGLRVEPRIERWASIIEDDVTDVFVAEVDGRIVGWATAGDGRDDDRPTSRELEGIYVLAAHHGTGAQLLLDAAIGAGDAYLWMMDDNPRAEAFYLRNGFVRDGLERDQVMAGHPIHIVRLVRHAAVPQWVAVKDAETALLDADVRRDAETVDDLLHLRSSRSAAPAPSGRGSRSSVRSPPRARTRASRRRPMSGSSVSSRPSWCWSPIGSRRPRGSVGTHHCGTSAAPHRACASIRARSCRRHPLSSGARRQPSLRSHSARNSPRTTMSS
jgi:GNAT superfamily N-acetyltransferase